MNAIKFGKNQFCGPSAMSAVLGITTDEAENVIQIVTKSKRKVTGVYEQDLVSAFRYLGHDCQKIEPRAYTVFGNLYHICGVNGYYIFTVDNHYITIEVNGNHIFICDNHSKVPVRASSSSRLGMRTVSIIKVDKR